MSTETVIGAGAAAAGGVAETDWKSTLPDDIKSEASLATIKSVNDLAKGFVHAQRLVGTDKIEAPSDKWDDAKWGALYDRLGRPKTPDEYKDPEGLTLHPSIKVDPVKTKAVRAELHKLGLTSKQQQAIEKLHFKELSDTVSAFESTGVQAKEATMAELTQEWRGNTASELEVAKRAVISIGGQGLMDYLDSSGMGNHAGFIKAMNKVGKMMMEDPSAKTSGSNALGLTDATSADQELSRMKTDPAFSKAFLNREDPGHAAAMAKWNELHKRKFSK